MLVLSRKVGEEIIIGDNIRVRIVSVQGNQIRLGFDAPREVSIQRAELLERAERDAAARTAAHVSDTPPAPDAVVPVKTEAVKV
jgi:carbon storage regulator